MRRDTAAAGADRNERAVVALGPRRDHLEAPGRHAPPLFVAAVDVAGRLRGFAGEPRAGVERTVRPDGVRVMLVDLARSHMHAVHRWKAAPHRFLAQIRHLLVEEVAVVAGTRHAGPGRRHARAAERLPVRADRGQCECAFHLGGLRRLDDWLERDLGELVGEVLLAQEVEQRGVAVDRLLVEVAADRDSRLAGDLPHVLEDLVERALAAAQRPHLVVGVAIAVERDLDPVQAQRRQPIDDRRRQQQPVGDDVDHHPHTAHAAALGEALGQVEQNRQVEERLAAEERQREARRGHRVQPLLGPLGGARGGVQRHLGGVLVVIAVIALDAVVAGEVALQRGQHGDPQLAAILAHVVEELVERLMVRGAALDDEAVVDQGLDRLALVGGELPLTAGDPVQHVGHVARHNQLCVRKRVHQEDVVATIERDTYVEHRGLHGTPSCRVIGEALTARTRGAADARQSATDIPGMLPTDQRVISTRPRQREGSEIQPFRVNSFVRSIPCDTAKPAVDSTDRPTDPANRLAARFAGWPRLWPHRPPEGATMTGWDGRRAR